MRACFALARLGLLVGLAGCAPTNGGGGEPALARTELTAACARLGACVPGFAESMGVAACSEYVHTAAGVPEAALAATLRCVNREAGDCGGVLACLNASAPASCKGDDPAACLDGARHWQCFVGTSLVADCTLAGGTCVAAPGGAACGLDACGPGYLPGCQGERLVECVSGVARAGACPDGARCQVGDAGAACVGRGAPCPAATPASCEGDELVSCVNGAEARVDCSADVRAATCQTDDTGVPRCVSTLDECDPAEFVERCNGARLEYCLDGRLEGADCAALGFARCAVGDPTAGVPSRCAPAPGGTGT